MSLYEKLVLAIAIAQLVISLISLLFHRWINKGE